MKVLLTKKYAECIDGVELRGRDVGDVLDLPVAEARLLVGERWAIPDRRKDSSDSTGPRRRADEREHGRNRY